MYILIILAMLNGPGGQIKALDHIEFPDKKTCVSAADSLEHLYKNLSCTCLEVSWE